MADVTLSEAVGQLPVAGLLVLFVIGQLRGWWVIGPRFTEMKKDRDYWRSIALRALGVAEKAASRGDR